MTPLPFAVLLLLAAPATPAARPHAPALAGGPPAASDLPAVTELDLRSARQEARERNALFVIVALQQGEESSDRVHRQLFTAKEFARATRDALVLPANDGEHPLIEVTEETDGVERQREVCSAFGLSRCGDHQRNMEHVFREYKVQGALPLPTVLVLLPDGTLSARLYDHDITADAVEKALVEGRAVAGPSASHADLVAARAEIDAARRAEAVADPCRAYRAWRAARDRLPAGVLAAEADRGIEAALASMTARMEACVARMEAGEVADGFRALLALEPDYEGTPLERDLASRIRAAERDPDWKEAARAVRREVEAEGLWREIVALEAEGKGTAALRAARKILRAYADTPAAERVRRRYPGLVDSGDEPTF